MNDASPLERPPRRADPCSAGTAQPPPPPPSRVAPAPAWRIRLRRRPRAPSCRSLLWLLRRGTATMDSDSSATAERVGCASVRRAREIVIIGLRARLGASRGQPARAGRCLPQHLLDLLSLRRWPHLAEQQLCPASYREQLGSLVVSQSAKKRRRQTAGHRASVEGGLGRGGRG
jgi:hypothetical protein